ncbi:uncharacterized protein V1513DRAFT_174599 [Lipomyces chichibuensis]|uniref:uncharacterized protein n=1 Tax=Lipomyces chichibuensis TaxID=1546026 RepID=UPI003343FC63
MSGSSSRVNNATTAATSAAIAASLASVKGGTISPSALQFNGNSRKISPSPAYDLRQSHGNSSTALSSAAAAARSVSSKPLPSDHKSAGNNPLNSDNVNVGVPVIRSQANAAGAPRISINGMQQLHHPREQHYQLNVSSMDAPRGRGGAIAGSAPRSPSAAATAAAQVANRHQVETLAINNPVSTPQTGLDPVAAAAKSYKSSSVSPSPRDGDTSIAYSTDRSVSPRSLASSVADVSSIQSQQILRSPSPAPSYRSDVSLSSSLEQTGVVGRIAEHINAGGVFDSKNVTEVKNDFEGADIQAAAKKAMVESHRLAKEQAQQQQEKVAMSKSSGAFIAARLIAKRGEEAAKAEELATVVAVSQAQSVLSKSTQEVVCPRPQRPTQHSILSAQQSTGKEKERPSSLASTYSALAKGHSTESSMNELASPVPQSLSYHLGFPWLDADRSESCPPGNLNPPRRVSSSAPSTVSVVKSEPRSIATRRTMSDDKANSTNGSSRPVAAASSQVLESRPHRLTKMSRIFQPFHSYNKFGAETRRVPGISSSASGRPSSIYGNVEASLSTMSLPAPRTIQDDQDGNQRLSRLSAEFAPMRTPFRTTMRKPEKKKHVFNAEKPWKHLIVSGTVSETERKRYGALWAANKGTLLPPELSDCVHNLVVRKLWERSRLNRDILEKVW